MSEGSTRDASARAQEAQDDGSGEPVQPVGAELIRVVTAGGDGPEDRRERARQVARLASALASSARAAGARAVLGGRWLVDQLLDAAPRIPVRDRETLRVHHPGLADADIAELLIRNAA